MTPYQREIIIRTIMGEALNEGPEGWTAVGHVIKNRSSDPRWPQDPASVALQPKQFSAWNEGHGGNDLVRKYGPDTPVFQEIGGVVDQVWSDQVPDPTGGATHYYAPAGMPGQREPDWFDDVTEARGAAPVRIGGHVFTGRRDGAAPSPPHPDVAHGLTPAPAPAPPEPEQRDWRETAGDAAIGILGSLGNRSGHDVRHATNLADTYQSFDEMAKRRKAWADSFTWS